MFLSYIKNLNLISAVGNHDLLNNGEELFRLAFGLFNFNFTILDYKFFIINNNNWESSSKKYYKEKNIYNSLNLKNNILVSHVSLLDKERFSKNQIIKNQELIKRFKFVFNGHDHNYQIKYFNETKKITIGSIDRRNYIELTLYSKDNYSMQRIKF